MNYDVIIIGAGSMGMAAGYYLSKLNNRVALIDAFDPPHQEGSHHGETRIIRHAYGEGENYVPMALRAQKLWLELEQEAKQKLFYQTGVLNIGAKNSPFIQNVIESAKRHSLEIETLTADEINNRWAGFAIEANLLGCYEANSGVLMSEACVQAYRNLAIDYGAKLFTNTIINDIEVSDESVTIDTPTNSIHGKKLIITAGKGTNSILSMIGEELPLQPTRKTFSWFIAEEEIYNEQNFPAWTYDVAGETYYGFPSIDQAGIKIGRHDGGKQVSANEQLQNFGTYPEDERDVTHLIEKLMDKNMDHKEGKVCTYTNTPDGDFIIDYHPNYQHIVLACGFSGHGFKFSSVVGELLCELVLEKETSVDIANFSLKRFRK